MPEEGEACDPSQPGSFRRDAVLHVEGLAEWDGLALFLRVRDTVDDVLALNTSLFIEGDRVTYALRDFFNPAYVSYDVEIFVDVDGSRSCEGEPAWRGVLGNRLNELAEPIELTIDAVSERDEAVCNAW